MAALDLSVMSSHTLLNNPVSVSDHDSDDLDNCDHVPIKRRARSKSVPKFPSTTTSTTNNIAKTNSAKMRSRKQSKLSFYSQELDLDEVNAELSTLNI